MRTTAEQVQQLGRAAKDDLVILAPKVSRVRAAQARPHRGLDLRTPIARSDPVVTSGPVRCDERLGGLLREYSRPPLPAAA